MTVAARSNHPQPEGIDYRRVTLGLALMALALAVVGSVVGYLLLGIKGLWGALVGAGVVGAMFASSALVMHLSRDGLTQARNLLISWFVKILALLGILLALDRATFIDRPVFGVTVLVGVIGSLALEGRVVWRARIPPGEGFDGI
ncbi:MAG: hypothetical protein LBO75_05205 [Bifidobacteriaceae bacterium]|nr:hypothetical protein [Bifidobacteriaceae bacterium]